MSFFNQLSIAVILGHAMVLSWGGRLPGMALSSVENQTHRMTDQTSETAPSVIAPPHPQGVKQLSLGADPESIQPVNQTRR